VKEFLNDKIVEFNNKASKIYSQLSEQFSISVRNIDRKKDENVFKMQVAKYSYELKNRLGECAGKIITADPLHREQIAGIMTARMNFYLQEFIQRCKSF
jgi:hypothetical protein